MRLLHRPNDFEFWQYNKQANIVYLSTIASYSFILPLFYVAGNMFIFYLNFLSLFIAILVYILNQKRVYALASLLFITTITTHTVAHIIVFGLGLGFTYYFFNMVALIMYTNWSNRSKLFGVLCEITVLVIVFQYSSMSSPITSITPLIGTIIHTMNVLFNIAGIGHSAFYYQNIVKTAKLQLEALANTDYLTKLPNRLSLNKSLDEIIKNESRGLGVLMVDIDHFKQINDTYGHLFGDEVLRCVSDVMKGLSREEDLVVRYGGEEFALFMEMNSLESLQDKAERLRTAIEETVITHSNKRVVVTASIGAYFKTTESQQSIEDCLRIADSLLYQAKDNGRNQVVALQS
jgi:diguanylate cyclase